MQSRTPKKVASPPVAVPPVGQQFRALNHHVYAAILQAITDRRIAPGERLRLDQLAAQLHVSRTPVRDALSRLVAQGLVQPAGRRGLSVTRLSPEDLDQLFDLRLMCELYALEKGVHRVSAILLREFRRSLDEIVRLSASSNPSDRLPQSMADRDFHARLVGLAGNPRLDQYYDDLNIHIHSVRVGPSLFTTRTRQAVNAREHEDILAALRRRHLAAAKAAVRRHIEGARRRAIESLKLQVAV
jgi:DNA-binding GntR family transcriptional regulator